MLLVSATLVLWEFLIGLFVWSPLSAPLLRLFSGNRYRRVPTAFLIWTAGFIEADGCIELWYVSASQALKGLASLYVLWAVYGGTLIRTADQTGATNQACFSWRLSGERATDLMRILLPYMVKKRCQALIHLECPRGDLSKFPLRAQHGDRVFNFSSVVETTQSYELRHLLDDSFSPPAYGQEVRVHDPLRGGVWIITPARTREEVAAIRATRAECRRKLTIAKHTADDPIEWYYYLPVFSVFWLPAMEFFGGFHDGDGLLALNRGFVSCTIAQKHPPILFLFKFAFFMKGAVRRHDRFNADGVRLVNHSYRIDGAPAKLYLDMIKDGLVGKVRQLMPARLLELGVITPEEAATWVQSLHGNSARFNRPIPTGFRPPSEA